MIGHLIIIKEPERFAKSNGHPNQWRSWLNEPAVTDTGLKTLRVNRPSFTRQFMVNNVMKSDVLPSWAVSQSTSIISLSKNILWSAESPLWQRFHTQKLLVEPRFHLHWVNAKAKFIFDPFHHCVNTLNFLTSDKLHESLYCSIIILENACFKRRV